MVNLLISGNDYSANAPGKHKHLNCKILSICQGIITEEVVEEDMKEKVEEKEEVRIKVTCQLFSVSRLGLYVYFTLTSHSDSHSNLTTTSSETAD